MEANRISGISFIGQNLRQSPYWFTNLTSEIRVMNKYTFGKGSNIFFEFLKERVDAYFAESKLHPAGNERLLRKGLLQFMCSAVLYVVLVFFTPVPTVSILLCILLGINLAVIGFNVMHEGGHQTFSRYAWLNDLSAFSLNVLGGSSYYWKIKHNVNHHTYTNIEGMDSDIDVKPFMRLHSDQPWRWYHRFQHIYWIFLYAISYIAWVFYEDFLKYFSGKVSSNGEQKRLPIKQHLIFWSTKVTYVIAYIVVPVIFVGWLQWLCGFLIITFVCGITTSIVFQLAHVVEGTEFHAVTSSGQKYEWAIHQMVSTSNFGTASHVLFWCLGGLNFQVEHHLFPRVSHIHYPAINRFVREACMKHGVVYNEHSTMRKAIFSHVTHLWKLGLKPGRT
jgi:linoleoyl-CoA desaturase